MSNEVTRPEKSQALDGFDGYEDRYEGNNEEYAGGIIQGALVKFTNEIEWVANGEALPADLELVAVDVLRVVQRWKDKTPIETIVLEPHQRIPDLDAMNEEIPKSEWVEDPSGKPRGPWQLQRLVYLLNSATMDRYTYVTGTTGGEIAIRELTDKTKWCRRFRGAHVHPVVTLSDCFMKTRFGGRQRPNFVIKRWIDLSGDGRALPAPAENTPKPPVLEQGMPERIVKEPNLAEQMNDELPF
jgi:hypothetical protein